MAQVNLEIVFGRNRLQIPLHDRFKLELRNILAAVLRIAPLNFLAVQNAVDGFRQRVGILRVNNQPVFTRMYGVIRAVGILRRDNRRDG